MADVDIYPFGEHESRPDEMEGESIPLIPVGTWEPERELGNLGTRNQNVNRKHRSEGCQVQELGLMLDL